MPPNPPYPNIPPPPTTSGNTVLKVILLVVAVLFLLGVIVAGVIGVEVYKMAKSIDKVRDRNVSISRPEDPSLPARAPMSPPPISASISIPEPPPAKAR
jgi:hypothetical protein